MNTLSEVLCYPIALVLSLSQQGWQYKIGTNKGSWDNEVHVTSLLLFK